jgi:hypothetical protein
MDIVTALPPSDGEAAAEVGDEHADERIDNEDLRDSSMSSIVCSEHNLMLHTECQRDAFETIGSQVTNPK